MKIPKSVKIGPFKYDVIYSADVAEEGDCFGSSHHRTQKIFLDPRNNQAQAEETFLHELIHAIHYVNGLFFRFLDKENVPSGEEITRASATTLYQVIQDNPKIFQ